MSPGQRAARLFRFLGLHPGPHLGVTSGYGILHSDIPGRTLTVPAGTPVFHTSIVVPGTRIRFQYFNIDAPGSRSTYGRRRPAATAWWPTNQRR